ncbi:MAG: ABC transporter permease subunit [Desulfobacter sp.]|nr:ABC transporter permease subunit [Desulfobacter sp.]
MGFGISITILTLAWITANHIFGNGLVPSLSGTMACLMRLALTPDFWAHISITLFRGIVALSITTLLALATGIPAGRNPKIMDMIMPLAAILQTTPPPILWITLVMVWAGTGTLLPVLVVTASLFPPLFISTATAAAHLDRRLFDLAQIYQIKKWVMIKDLILPGIFPHFLAGFSYALGSCLKITAVAEFLGADQGMGARVYWAFRMMDMEALFAWALVLISIGVSMEIFWIRPLRVLSSKKGGQNADP